MLRVKVVFISQYSLLLLSKNFDYLSLARMNSSVSPGISMNFQGPVININVFVLLTVPPRVVLQLPVVRALPGYKLWCSATGSPPIFVAVIRNATVLANTTHTATVILHEQGNHKCVATSKYGTGVREFSVILTGETILRQNLASFLVKSSFPTSFHVA